MKIINCPLNGPRNAQEFVCGGEVNLPPAQHNPGDEANNRQWVEYVFMEENPYGVIREWWCHIASGYWFIAERDTVTDTMIRTFTARELFDQTSKTDSAL
jgi:sarcosine oxidase subunit delta